MTNGNIPAMLRALERHDPVATFRLRFDLYWLDHGLPERLARHVRKWAAQDLAHLTGAVDFSAAQPTVCTSPAPQIAASSRVEG